ncbi:hypothetical protein A2W14_01670 [Candidatus Gottesmanbacteria bacterium RBG_16_37_8]|uniref:ATP-grasp domain-containing protein n=1 Tax=Candidatus Gottesmanbacteria bacterium RBG_16_37_8 TaxID=1798371 RepID=A0A1F5YQK5_9BACT|nr:MAG: hypothetical protein A2W14_01670 [Candidatus Gottesmanbacteria bacterium RBG_16_37_8]
MKNWPGLFIKYPLFFVSPDIKRGLGLEDLLPDFHLICSYYDSLIPVLRRNKVKILCLQESADKPENIINNSGSLLSKSPVLNYIRSNSGKIPAVAFFKPSLKIDFLLKKYKFIKVGNNYEQNEKFENKIKFLQIFSKLIPDYLTPFTIEKLHDLEFSCLAAKFKLPFVIQFGHGWAGKTTFFISGESSFNKLKNTFPQTTVKVSRYINGFTVLNNCCLYKDKVLVSPPALQINGFSKLSSRQYVTCGRQWPLIPFEKSTVSDIFKLSQKIGRIMNKSGFKGYFGLDFLIEGNSGRLYVSEINGRLTAASAFYAKLERGKDLIPLLAYHYASFLGIDLPVEEISPLISGSQVIIRNLQTDKKINLNLNGVYQISGKKIEYQFDDYRPQDLKENQFIYHQEKIIKTDSEISRIESLRQALSSPFKLSPWLVTLLA